MYRDYQGQNVSKNNFTGIIGEILALLEEDPALLTNATTIQGALSELDFGSGWRLYLLEETPKVSEAHLEPIQWNYLSSVCRPLTETY